MTFTVDDDTARRIDTAAELLRKPKSAVVREAVADYHQRIGRLTEAERRRMLKILDDVLPDIPRRPQGDADNEIAAVRQSRKSSGRRSKR